VRLELETGINLNEIQAGLYIITFSDGENRYSERLIIR
jgi:hypothetical protein